MVLTGAGNARGDNVGGRDAGGRDARASVTKGARTRQAILDAAIVRFGRDGYRATSVADITRDAGVSGTAAYAYFDGKEALFFAAVDEDAAGMIGQGLSSLEVGSATSTWRQSLFFTLLQAVEDHPLARRLLAGLEPEVTERVLQLPALEELRKACTELLRTEQVEGTVRPDIDPVAISNGVIALTLSLLMSVVQFGPGVALTYVDDVAAVFDAALDPR